MAARKAVVVTLLNSAPFLRTTLIVPKSLVSELKLQVGQVVTLWFGQLQQSVRILMDDLRREYRQVIWLSDDVVKALNCPIGKTLSIRVEDNRLRIGPIVGILANVRTQKNAPSGMQEPVFIKLLAAAESQHAFAYLFTPRDVNFTAHNVKGYVWSEKSGWSSVQAPLPDVIYDQLISRKFANSELVKQFQRQIDTLSTIPYFNPSFFDKWEVHQWLYGENAVQSYLPQTSRYESISFAALFLNNHQYVYVKPVNGSLGKGIIRIDKDTSGSFHYQIKSKTGIDKEGNAATAHDVFSALHKRLIAGDYIVQQGLHLATYQGRPFDIRILTQKDHAGKWRRTKSFCRIAQEGDITSNLATGGYALPVAKVLEESIRSKDMIKKIQKDLSSLIRTAPEVIEHSSGLLLGELGFDVGVDVRGNVWLIEVNARPWKKPTTEQGSMEIVNQSFTRPIQYAIYLAGF
ncbi:MAG: hypothetical protein JWN30_69 [Bacilli bacterium]|nr:hypothetical protein [Bacilli bacterium]